MKKLIKSAVAAGGAFFVSATTVLASNHTTVDIRPPGGTGFERLGDLTFPELIQGLISIILIVAAIIFFFVLVIGGIRWILSGGDKTATEAARGQITAALVGLVIVFAAWAIVQLIETLFGVKILQLQIQPINR